MAAETTKFQVNFKTHKDGTLINIYADNVKDLETQITDISMLATLIKTTEKELLSTPGAALSVDQVARQLNATPVSSSPEFNDHAAASSSAHVCKHGTMGYREGVGAKGPWKGYMCASPKGTPQAEKCPTIWVR